MENSAEGESRVDEIRDTLSTLFSHTEMPFLLPLLHSPLCVVMTDLDGKIFFWNDGAEQTFKFSQEEAIGMPVVHLIPPVYRQAHLEGIERLKQLMMSDPAVVPPSRVIGKSSPIFGLRKDGQEFACEISLSVFGTGEKACVLAFINDISAHLLRERMGIMLSSINAAQKILDNTIEKLDKYEEKADKP